MKVLRGMIAKSILAFAGATAFATFCLAASESFRFDIPSQPLSTALNELARQSGVQVIYFSDILSGAVVPRLYGEFTFDEALSLLLKGTGLTFRTIEGRSVFIETRRAPEMRSAAVPSVVQLTPSGDAGMTDAGTGIPEAVIVTARRREESMMDIPFSIDVLTGRDIAERSIDNLLQANGQFSNVWIRTDPFSGTAGLEISMRGIAGAVLYQDGVRIRFGALPAMLDTERVEVMRGPQGTLFGRNAIGGTIQVVTARPVQSYFGAAEFTGGNHGRRDIKGKLNVPLGDDLAVSVTAAALNRDGFVRSSVTGMDFGSQDDRFVRLDSLWRPAPDMEIRAQYSRLLNRSNGQAYVNFRLDAVCPGDPVPAGYRNSSGEQIFFAPNAYCILSQVDLDPVTPGLQPYTDEFHSYGQHEAYVNTIRSEDMGWWQRINDAKLDVATRIAANTTLHAIVSRRWGTENSAEDLDGTGLDIFQNNLNALQEFSDQRTAEVQLLYRSERLSGITGLYWEHAPGSLQKRLGWVHNELTIPELAVAAEAAYPGSTDFRLRPESAPFNTADFFRISKTTTTQWAAFTEWSWAVTRDLQVSAGIRFTRQEGKRIRYRPGAAGAAWMPPVRCCDLEAGVNYFEPAGPAEFVRLPVYNQWTPRVSLQYDWSAAVMTYLTYAKGGNAGGIDVNPPPGMVNSVYRPQTIHTLEAGLRVRMDDGRTQLDFAAFHSDFRDAQILEELFPGTLRTGNAHARVWGFEFDGTTELPPWRFDYGLGWLRTEYTDTGTTFNLREGTPFPYAPDLNISAGIAFEQQWRRYGLLARVDHTWQAETTTSADPVLAQPVPSRGLLSARLEIRPTEGPWHVALSGTNLTREFYFTSGFLLPADQSFAGFMGRPREWSVSVGVRFE